MGSEATRFGSKTTVQPAGPPTFEPRRTRGSDQLRWLPETQAGPIPIRLAVPELHTTQNLRDGTKADNARCTAMAVRHGRTSPFPSTRRHAPALGRTPLPRKETMTSPRRHAATLLSCMAVTLTAAACTAETASTPTTTTPVTTSVVTAAHTTHLPPTTTAAPPAPTALETTTAPTPPPAAIAPAPPAAVVPTPPAVVAPVPPRPAAPNVYYSNCAAAKAAGAAPLRRGEPGYRSELDRDKDGVACE
ncbi:excalibur calcium-binding domain-containing protein [Nocardia sp. NPDC005745]|uniref:excalibur calcium-binding domain-containing protein n=1 Tax=Nocardia sp. NPDC005745 TaxID=3157061 RepID=UPI0033E2B06C